MVITEELAIRVRDTVAHGLVSGVGQPEPGQMCVEAAVCYAMGLPHGDRPTCVAPSVRAYKIGLNDANWSSPQVRAKGMARVAIAQLGSDSIDERAFVSELALQTIRQILPLALRAAGLEEHAAACESSTLLKGARAAADAAAADAAAAAEKAKADSTAKADSMAKAAEGKKGGKK